jgi:hypothetical protein
MAPQPERILEADPLKDGPPRGIEHHLDARVFSQYPQQRRVGVARVLSFSRRLIMDVCLRILEEDAEAHPAFLSARQPGARRFWISDVSARNQSISSSGSSNPVCLQNSASQSRCPFWHRVVTNTRTACEVFLEVPLASRFAISDWNALEGCVLQFNRNFPSKSFPS